MHEIELKFGIPANKVAALKKRIDTRTAIKQTLKAYYFDTTEGALASAKVALRIRQEDDIWVQTVKTKGDGIAKRREENVELGLSSPKKADITPDLTLFSSDIQALLSSIAPLDELTSQLSIQYGTEVTRTSRIIKRLGSVVEICFDDGKVISGRKSAPLTEVEFELLSGSMDFLIQTAESWCQSFGLYMLSISKAERGKRLQTGEAYAKAVKSDLGALSVGELKLQKGIGQSEFFQAVVANCLQHILPNISELALGSDDPNHVHQARVGMRRLRTALSSFAGFAGALLPAEILSAHKDSLKHTFSLLGESRDLYILTSQTQPELEACGAPSIDITASTPSLNKTPAQAVCESSFQTTLLGLINFCAKPMPYKPSAQNIPAKQVLSSMLTKQFRKIRTDSLSFTKLSIEEKHEVRKRLKKLRYVSEFAAPLYSSKKMGEFFNYLAPAQELLGEFNDAAVGLEKYQAMTTVEPKAWFAVGWFAAREAEFAQKCAKKLKAVKDAPTFW